MLKANARACLGGCFRYKGAEEFPDTIAKCCEDKKSVFCTSCLDDNIKTKIDQAVAQSAVTCPMCHIPIAESDMRKLVDERTFRM